MVLWWHVHVIPVIGHRPVIHQEHQRKLTRLLPLGLKVSPFLANRTLPLQRKAGEIARGTSDFWHPGKPVIKEEKPEMRKNWN